MKIIGEKPLAKDSSGTLLSRIGTLFVKDKVLITLPRMAHFAQRQYYQQIKNVAMEDLEDAVDLKIGRASCRERVFQPV
jgi:hypothetical protein